MLDRDRVHEVFAGAVGLAGEARLAFLASACAADDELRTEIESLLRAAEGGPAFMAAPAALGSDPAERPGAQVGPYRLLQEIGEGGFGTVYMAEQAHPVRRTVALKIIKLGMDTRAVIARFEAERQAPAMMDHQHIARVLDAGATESGRPYFVMELVNGDPITRYCDQHNLSIPERLALFVQVCNAVQHAHTKGVIHRDIKPTNVLVATQDGRPHAKVIDFGIAKATEHRLTEKTLFTEFRQLVGTPEYMSPEQAAGSRDIDTRSDVYSLGVLLYELLTGDTPFDPKELRSAAYAEIQRIIREVDPPKPSTRLSQSAALAGVATRRRTEPARLGSLVRGDLDWIVMRALEKDRARRYDTPSALASDIERHQGGEPIAAAPPSARYRLGKLVRRHRALVVSGGFIAVVLLLGVVGTSLGLVRANRARADETRQRTAAQRSSRRAEEQAARAARAEDRANARAAELERVVAFQAAQLADIRPMVMADDLRIALLTEAESSLDRAGMDAARRDQFARDLEFLNLSNVALRVLEQSLFHDALDGVRREFAEQPLVRATLLLSLAQALHEAGLYDEVESPLDEAIEIRTRSLGSEDEETLDALGVRARFLISLGRTAEAEPILRRIYDVRLRGGGVDDEDTMIVLADLAQVLGAQGRFGEAESLVAELLDRSVRTLGAAHPISVAALGHLGNVQMARGDLVQAEKTFLDAMHRSEGFTGKDEEHACLSASNYGLALLRQGRFPEAEAALGQAAERSRRALGDEHRATLLALNNLGATYIGQEKVEAAADLYERLHASCRKALGAQHPMTLTILANLANAFNQQGQRDRAEAVQREVLIAQRATLGPDHENTILTMYSLGSTLREGGDLDEAESLSREAFERACRILPPDHRWRIVATTGLGRVLTARASFAEAESILMLAEPALASSGADSASASPAAKARYLKWAAALAECYAAWEASEPGTHGNEAAAWKETVTRLETAPPG